MVGKFVLRLVACVMAVCLFAGSAPAEKYALLVGVCDYADARIPDLKGPANDVRLMRMLLTKRYGFESDNVRVLEAVSATKQSILDEFDAALVRESAPGDWVLFYFSGHGTQVPDRNDDERDQLDEALLPSDADPDSPSSALLDDDLLGLLRGLEGRRAVVILDCCHAGTATRRVPGFRGMRYLSEESQVRGYTFPGTDRFAVRGVGLEQGWEDVQSAGSGHLLLTAVQADQKALETSFELSDGVSRRHGAYTFHLGRGLIGKADGDDSGVITFSELHEYATSALLAHSQSPTMEGAESFGREAAFGGASVPAGAVVVAKVTDGTAAAADAASKSATIEGPAEKSPGHRAEITVDAGAFAGALPGSIFAVYPEGGSAERPAGLIEVASAGDEEALASVVSGKVEPGYLATCVFRPPSVRNLRVSVEGGGETASILRDTLAGLDVVDVVGSEHADRRVVVEGPSRARVLNPWGDTVRGGIRGDTPEQLAGVIGRHLVMNHFARQIASMENPNPRMDVSLRVVPETHGVVQLGEPLVYEVECDQDAQILLFAIDSAGDVTVLYPNAYSGKEPIRAGRPLRVPGPTDDFEIVASEPRGEVVTKVFVYEEGAAPTEQATRSVRGGFDTYGTRAEVESLTRGLRSLFGDSETQVRWATASVVQEYQ